LVCGDLGTKYGTSVDEELAAILVSAKVAESTYHVVEWGQSKDQFIVSMAKSLKSAD